MADAFAIKGIVGSTKSQLKRPNDSGVGSHLVSTRRPFNSPHCEGRATMNERHPYSLPTGDAAVIGARPTVVL
jgi:hypothetical protein